MINNFLRIIYTVLDNPLSLLRFFLSFLFGRYLIGRIRLVSNFSEYPDYMLSRTWITGLLPDSFFVFDSSLLDLFSVCILVLTIGSMLGILGRLSLILLSFCSFYIFGTLEGYGAFDHHASLPSQIIFALGLVPGSMRISLDTYLYRKFSNTNGLISNKLENPAKWSVNLILTLVALTYLTAGISKIRYGGINWLDGSTLGFYMQDRTFEYEKGKQQLIIGNTELSKSKKWKDNYGFYAHTYGNYQSSNLALRISDWIASKEILLIFLSISTIILECLGFIIFINTKYRNLYLFLVIFMHTTIGFLMGLTFTQYRVLCLCLIDWKAIALKFEISEKLSIYLFRFKNTFF